MKLEIEIKVIEHLLDILPSDKFITRKYATERLESLKQKVKEMTNEPS